MAKRSTSVGIKKSKGALEAPEARTKRISRVIAVSVWLYCFSSTSLPASYHTVLWRHGACARRLVAASKLAASWHYFRPGQSGYGPHAFGEYYCTEQDARNAGFNPSPW
jgi:hypothetical protein